MYPLRREAVRAMTTTEPTLQERLANDNALVMQSAQTFQQVGILIETAQRLSLAQLLDWPSIAGFVTETMFTASSGAGYEHEEIAPAIAKAVESDHATTTWYRKTQDGGK